MRTTSLTPQKRKRSLPNQPQTVCFNRTRKLVTLSEPATIKHSEKTYKKQLFQLASNALIVKKNYYSKALEYLSTYLQIYTKGDYLWVWHVIWFIKLHFKL